MKKYAVVSGYDLRKGECYLAKHDRGEGEVALFETRQAAQEWVEKGEDIDSNTWDINIIEVSV